MQFIDTHAHLNSNAFKEDRDEVIKKCLENDIWIINVGTNYETSKRAVEIAEGYEKGVFSAIGLHPLNLDTGLIKLKPDLWEEKSFEKDFDYEKYKELGKSKKVVAIGEIGLDYYWRPKTKKKKELFKQKQKELLLKQLELAKELNLPVIFHCRMAHKDLIEVLKSQIPNFKFQIQNSKPKGVIHSFSGNWEEARKYLEMGFYIGFNGIIFKNIEGIDFRENIKKTPLNKILIETDCPYLTPPDFPEERNNPLGVKFVAKRIAEIKNINLKDVAEVTTENARELFFLS